MSESEDLLAIFVQESVEHLENIEPAMLILEEKGADTEQEVINSLFRGVHSIKGSAGFFDLHTIGKLSHVMENLLGLIRDKTIAPNPEISDTLLAGVDKLRTMVHDVGNSENIDVSEEIAAIQALIDSKGGSAAPSASAAPAQATEETDGEAGDEAEDEMAQDTGEDEADDGSNSENPLALEHHPDAVAGAVRNGQRFYELTVTLDQDGNDNKKSALEQFVKLVESVGPVLAFHPALGGDGALPKLPDNLIRLLITTVLEEDLLQALIQLPPENIHPLPIPESMARKGGGSADPTAKPPTAAGEQAPKPPAKAKPPAPAPVAENVDAGAEMESFQEEMAQAASASRGAASRLRKPQTQEKGATDSGKAKKEGISSQPVVEETLRVSVALLDELINMAGELVLTRNQLIRTSNDPNATNLGSLVQNLDSITSRIQEKVMQARMQPVSVVFSKFPRIIRDLAKKLDKKIDLELRGGDVELDKSVIEQLSDPLTHMIRNVADHGIEPPKVRLDMGKPEAGRVSLAAYHENGMVNIALIDDGAGIDPERIKTKALEKGLITESEADEMSKEEILELVFAPGFSMAKKVSDVSGRGVGMDVVRTNIEKMRGTVHISSKLGKGTRIILKLPLTLAIIPAMIVSSGRLRFAIPEIGLAKIVRVVQSELVKKIQMVCQAPVLRFNGKLLPLVEMSEVLELNKESMLDSGYGNRRQSWLQQWSARQDGSTDDDAESGDETEAGGKSTDPTAKKENPATEQTRELYIMVINVGGNEFGLVVDDVLDSEEIVVKSLPSFCKDNICFSATSILGDGGVTLIIDYAGIMEKAKINFSGLEQVAMTELDASRRSALREKQNIILLETGTGLIFGVVNSMVGRVEKISRKQMENINGQPYVRYGDKTFHAIYPDHILGLSGDGIIEEELEEGEEPLLCMVIPTIPDLQAGLVFSRVIDTMETYIELDRKTIHAEGLFGSARINNRVVLFPDLNVLFQMAGVLDQEVENQPDYDGLSALVVDDTPFLRTVTVNFLSQAGFKVKQAEDGRSALNQLKTSQFDLVVADLNMPIMSGFELAKEIPSTFNTETPVIATTSSISRELENQCIQTGMVGCVPSMDKSRLLNMIASLQRV